MNSNGEANSELLQNNLEDDSIRDERNILLSRIKELENENEALRENSVNNGNKTGIYNDLNSELDKYVKDIDGTIKYSLQILDDKNNEIKNLNDKIIENNTKWKNYVKLLIEQIGRKNSVIDQMKEEMNRLFEKSKNQELVNKENSLKLVSYEELIQIDQQLIKQNKQLETELRYKIDKLDAENKKYVNTIKSLNESNKKKYDEYKKKITTQVLIINNLSSIVENFKGRYLYNNIGRQKGIINQINIKSKFYASNDSNNVSDEKMNPLEYEFGIIWKSSQEKIIERKCELFEIILNLNDKKNQEKYISDESLYINDLIDNLNKNGVVNSGNIPITELILMYSNFVNRVMGLYEIFCKLNLLTQYLQFKALRYLQIDQVRKFISNGEYTGIIHWICNIVIQVSKLIISLGEIITNMRINLNNNNDSNALFQKLPCLGRINDILSWINNIFQDTMNDSLNQSNNYEIIKEFNVELIELIKSNSRDNVLPLCCIDAIMNINISLAIISSIYIKQVDCDKYNSIYKKSLNISDKFYSKCGSLSLNGIQYPIDYRIYTWDSLYWSNIYDQISSTSFDSLFKYMLNSQIIIYDYINNNNNNNGNIVDSIEILLSSVQELESNIEKFINPIYTIDKSDEIENIDDYNNDLNKLNILPELLISKNMQQKLLYHLDDQLLEDENKQEKETNDNVDNIPNEDNNQIPSSVKVNTESPKRIRMENTIKSLNDKIQKLKKELTSKNLLYSSFGAMDVEFKKLQDYKQTLMHKIKEQEIDIQLKKEQINNNETTIKELKYETDLLKQNVENLSNLPKIKAYSELDVLEPVYLRRMVRIMNNRLYEIEMSRWNEMIIKDNPNFFLKHNFNKKFLLSQIIHSNGGDSEDKLNNIIKNFLKNNGNIEHSSNYIELLYIVNEYRELRKQVLLHKCSIPIYNSNNVLKFKEEWREYIKRESDLKYKLYIMKKTLKELLLDLRIDSKCNIENNSNYINNKNKIGKLKLKLPYSDSIISQYIKKNNLDSLEINTREWNNIIKSITKY